MFFPVKKDSLTGNRTPAACVTGRNTDHYTIKDGVLHSAGFEPAPEDQCLKLAP